MLPSRRQLIFIYSHAFLEFKGLTTTHA